MKNKLIMMLMLVGVLACSDDFTESPAVGALSDAALQNETGVNLMLTGAYSAIDGIRQNSIGEGWGQGPSNWMFDVLADDAHKGSTDGDQPELYNVETLNWSTGGSYFLGKWSALWAGVQRANAVIALINTIEGGNFNTQLAEARFLRGHFNFELTKIYKYIPYISEEDYANTEFNKPNPGPIWDEIEADFMFAMDNLPSTQEGDVGRPNSWVARAFLGKTHLYQGEWAEALTLLRSVVEDGPFDLMPDYVDNFRLAGDNSVEALFSIQFTIDGGQSYNASIRDQLNFINGGPYGSCCGFYMPSQDLLNAFKTDGTGLPELDTFGDTDVTSDLGIPSDDPFIPYAGPLDPRVDYTIGRRGIDYNGYGINPGADWLRNEPSDISGSYFPRKNTYWSGEEGDNQATGGWGQQMSGINFHIMRFADVILMYAEAAVETGDIPTALAQVNKIRNRAKTSNYVQDPGGGDAANYQIEPYTSFPDQDYARKAVRFERRLEMGMEGQRYFDIVRWGGTTERMNQYVQNESRSNPQFGSEAGTWSDKFNNYPIPITAIDQSGGVLTQNPVW